MGSARVAGSGIGASSRTGGNGVTEAVSSLEKKLDPREIDGTEHS